MEGWDAGDGCEGSVAAGTKATRLRLMPAPKTRWSWRGIVYSSSSWSMSGDV